MERTPRMINRILPKVGPVFSGRIQNIVVLVRKSHRGVVGVRMAIVLLERNRELDRFAHGVEDDAIGWRKVDLGTNRRYSWDGTELII